MKSKFLVSMNTTVSVQCFKDELGLNANSYLQFHGGGVKAQIGQNRKPTPSPTHTYSHAQTYSHITHASPSVQHIT